MNELDRHNIILNFEKVCTGDTVLNFNATDESPEPSQYQGYIESKVCFNQVSEIEARFDLNFILGVSLQSNFIHEHTDALEKHSIIHEAKPLNLSRAFQVNAVKAHFIDQIVCLTYQYTQDINTFLNAAYEQSKSVYYAVLSAFEENNKLLNSCNFKYENTVRYQIGLVLDWQERIRLRRNSQYAYQVARYISQSFDYSFDIALEMKISKRLKWEKARAIYYRKSKISPWPKPKQPEYQGSTILNFIEPLEDIDPFNVILNFGSGKVIPELYHKKWWYIVNEISVARLDNNEKILVYDGSYNTDRGRWCWSYSLNVPASEISKLEPIGGQPVILKIMVNGNEHHMMLENRTRSQKFASITYSLTGRSITALLDSPYAATRSFTQENERTSVQLVQAELDRANHQIDLKWQLIDDLGWIVPSESLSYSNLSPIAAIKLLTEAGGGFIYSDKASRTLNIKPMYKKTFWNFIDSHDYDVLLPESIVTDLSTDYEIYPDYNGVTLTNDRTGLTGQIKRRDTAGDVLCECVNNALFEASSMEGYAKIQLAKAGMVETHNMVMPLAKEIGECVPGDLIGYNGEWWGIIDSVSVSFNYAVVNQTIKVERVNRNE